MLAADLGGRPALQFVAEARSEGFFAWLFRFRVRDRTVATWDPASGCSLAIEKHLREGRAARDQIVTFDPEAGTRRGAGREDCPDALRRRAVRVGRPLGVLRHAGARHLRDGAARLPVFDNGKRYELGIRFVERDRLDLPAPLGRKVPVVVVEPQLLEGTGLFVKKGRLKIWLTDDARRIPVRMRSKVAVGSVSADLEAYDPPTTH